MNSNSGWRIIRSYIRHNWLFYLAGVGLVAAGSLLAALVPRLIGRIEIDQNVLVRHNPLLIPAPANPLARPGYGIVLAGGFAFQ